MFFLRVFFSALIVFAIAEPAFASDSAEVLKGFNESAKNGDLVDSFDKIREQHEILFFMGIVLLVFIFATAGFGLALGLYGKKVFVYHMLCAGVTVFLSIAHAVVAIVWFNPFR